MLHPDWCESVWDAIPLDPIEKSITTSTAVLLQPDLDHPAVHPDIESVPVQAFLAVEQTEVD